MKLSKALRTHAEWWISPPGVMQTMGLECIKYLQYVYPNYPNLPLCLLMPDLGNEIRCYLCLLEAELQEEEEWYNDGRRIF